MNTPRKPIFSRRKLSPDMTALVDAVRKPVPPADGIKIIGETFQGINIETSLVLLLDSKDSFYGHKDIIFAGFCAWLTDSSDYHSSADAIALATADMIVAAESSKRLEKVPIHHRFLMQAEAAYQPLFNQVYYNIGGLASLMKASANATLRHPQADQKAAHQIRYLVAMATIWDYHVRKLYNGGDPYGFPNIEDAAPLAGHLVPARTNLERNDPSQRSLSASQVRNELWPEHHRAIALLYAADRVQLADGTTILDRLLARRLTYKDSFDKLPTWLSYARHFTDNVISKVPLRAKTKATPQADQHGVREDDGKLTRNGIKPRVFPAINAVEAVQPPLVALEPELITLIEKAFSMKKPSEKVMR